MTKNIIALSVIKKKEDGDRIVSIEIRMFDLLLIKTSVALGN